MIPNSLNDNLAFLVGDLNQRIYQAVSRVFRSSNAGITIEQFSVLTVLWYEDGLKQQEIASRLNRDKTTITRVINNMVRQNLVVRVPDKTDLRASMIFLTHYGKQMQNQMAVATGNIYLKLLEGIHKKDLAAFKTKLVKMIGNMNSFLDR